MSVLKFIFIFVLKCLDQVMPLGVANGKSAKC